MSTPQIVCNIYVYINGDARTPARRILVSSKYSPSFSHLLQHLSAHHRICHSAIRKLYHISSGKLIKHLDELNDGDFYAASCGESLKDANYELDPDRINRPPTALDTRLQSMHALPPIPNKKEIRLQKISAKFVKRGNPGPVFETPFVSGGIGIRVIVFKNGQPIEDGIQTILNWNNAKNFDQGLKEIRNALNIRYGIIRRIFDAETGKPITNLHQLSDGQNIVASTYEGFKKCAYRVQNARLRRRDSFIEDPSRPVTFFPNGDTEHFGWALSITVRKFPVMETLLDYLDNHVEDELCGKVWSIVSLEVGHEGEVMRSPAELKAGGQYVLLRKAQVFIDTDYAVNIFPHVVSNQVRSRASSALHSRAVSAAHSRSPSEGSIGRPSLTRQDTLIPVRPQGMILSRVAAAKHDIVDPVVEHLLPMIYQGITFHKRDVSRPCSVGHSRSNSHSGHGGITYVASSSTEVDQQSHQKYDKYIGSSRTELKAAMAAQWDGAQSDSELTSRSPGGIVDSLPAIEDESLKQILSTSAPEFEKRKKAPLPPIDADVPQGDPKVQLEHTSTESNEPPISLTKSAKGEARNKLAVSIDSLFNEIKHTPSTELESEPVAVDQHIEKRLAESPAIQEIHAFKRKAKASEAEPAEQTKSDDFFGEIAPQEKKAQSIEAIVPEGVKEVSSNTTGEQNSDNSNDNSDQAELNRIKIAKTPIVNDTAIAANGSSENDNSSSTSEHFESAEVVEDIPKSIETVQVEDFNPGSEPMASFPTIEIEASQESIGIASDYERSTTAEDDSNEYQGESVVKSLPTMIYETPKEKIMDETEQIESIDAIVDGYSEQFAAESVPRMISETPNKSRADSLEYEQTPSSNAISDEYSEEFMGESVPTMASLMTSENTVESFEPEKVNPDDYSEEFMAESMLSQISKESISETFESELIASINDGITKESSDDFAAAGPVPTMTETPKDSFMKADQDNGGALVTVDSEEKTENAVFRSGGSDVQSSDEFLQTSPQNEYADEFAAKDEDSIHQFENPIDESESTEAKIPQEATMETFDPVEEAQAETKSLDHTQDDYADDFSVKDQEPEAEKTERGVLVAKSSPSPSGSLEYTEDFTNEPPPKREEKSMSLVDDDKKNYVTNSPVMLRKKRVTVSGSLMTPDVDDTPKKFIGKPPSELESSVKSNDESIPVSSVVKVTFGLGSVGFSPA